MAGWNFRESGWDMSNQMVGGCCVCLDERGWKENPLVYCDGNGCNVAVHKNCYGITKVKRVVCSCDLTTSGFLTY